MNQHALRRAALKAHYGFDDWGVADAKAPAPLRRDFLIAHEALGDYQFAGRSAFPGQRGAYIDYFQSIKDPEIHIAVMIQKFPTSLDAKEGLLNILENCMNPDVPRLSESGIQAGDIGFGGEAGGTASIFFTRNNILVKAHNTGSKTSSLEGLVKAIDGQITAQLAKQ